MKRFTKKIVNLMKSENMFESQGGPIILSQIENEYGSVGKTFGGAGHNHMTWAANLAVGLGTGVPWVMCNQDDAPDPIDHNHVEQGVTQAKAVVDPQPSVPAPSANILGDLLSPLAIEGPPGVSGIEGVPSADDTLALAPIKEQENTVQPIGDIAERFHALCLKDSGFYMRIVIFKLVSKQSGGLIRAALSSSWETKILLHLPQFKPSYYVPPSHLRLELSLVPEIIPPRAKVKQHWGLILVVFFMYSFSLNIESYVFLIDLLVQLFTLNAHLKW